jgi:triosephosphate isomerase
MDQYGDKIAKSMRILYGGSVNETNAASFIIAGEANGLLVGRVSLEPKRFALLAKSITQDSKQNSKPDKKPLQ